MSYEQILRIHLLPRFGKSPLQKITRDQVRTFLSELSASGNFGHGTLRNILATIRAILSYALEDGVVTTNAAVRLGRVTLRGSKKQAAEFLTREKTNQFLNTSRIFRPERHALFLTALRAGLRLGELIALERADIQFGRDETDPNRFILVRHNFPEANSLAPRTVGSLNGSNIFNRDFLPCLVAAGMRRVTFHALRHTFASLLLQRGASLAYVKEQMGHSSIQVTVDTYRHLIPGGNIEWVDSLDAKSSPQQSATQAQPAVWSRMREWPQVTETIGGPTRT